MALVKRRKRADEPSKLNLDLDPNASIENTEFGYQPKSELTATVYGQIIKFVEKKLGFQPDNIIVGSAGIIIDEMKNPNHDEESRRREVTKYFPDEELDDIEYNQLLNLCKKMDDWDMGATFEAIEDEGGAIGNIVSDDEDNASDEYLSEVRDSDDEFNLDEMFETEQREDNGLDLEELARKQTSIVPRVNLGEPKRYDGFLEYNIEPKKAKHSNSRDLISVKDLSENEQVAFSVVKIRELNHIQSRIYNRAMKSDKSLLICAPTGAGKTNIALLTMLREILKHPNENGIGFNKDKFKIIYVAPIKALVQEVVENFTKRLGIPPYNLVVRELTGDHQLDQREISGAQLIVCTPEKWDIVTRKSLDRLYTKLVKLVIFDEIHLLHNERGATLEALIARIKRHRHIEGERIRIVGLSATLPNYQDVARFISPEDTIENSTVYFDSSYRPIPLHQQYLALTESKKVFRMINDIVYDKVIEQLAAPNSQVLIFVHSRPDTVKTAEYIKTKALEPSENKIGLITSGTSISELIEEEELNPKLRELLKFGLGTHHAGMTKNERSCVEKLFRDKSIRVLVSTATLAWGVNLPAKTVIIKGTQVYRDGRWTDLDSLDVTQMLGRAGRPGSGDKEGMGIVITQQSKVAFYISLMTEQLPVESKLIARLADFINAECVIGNIEDLKGAVNWISETFLNSRMLSVMSQDDRQYMTMYGITPEMRQSDPKLKQHKRNLAYNAACILDKRGLIEFDRVSESITSKELGRIASDFNCSSRTIEIFNTSIDKHTSDNELLRIFSLADEFKDIFVRRSEEADLQTLLNSKVPFPIDDKRAKPGEVKVNVLLQAYIFQLEIEGSDLICDMHFIKDNAARLARAIHEIVLMKKFAAVAELSLDLCRKIDMRMTSCHSPLRQFVNDIDSKIIIESEKKSYSVEEWRILDADKITKLLKTDAKTGKKIQRLFRCLPKLKIESSRLKPISRTSIKVELTIVQDFDWNEDYHGLGRLRFWLFVEDVNQEELLHYEIIHMRESKKKIRISFFVRYLTPVHPFYFIKIFPERWFGCDQHLSINIDALTIPDDSLVFTQPPDIALTTSISSLHNKLFEKYYADKKIQYFNQMQTETFEALYKKDDDVILLASAGSGKTTCAELAIIHNIEKRGTSSKCAYIAANAQASAVVYKNWRKLFEHYGVMQLTGNHRTDVARVDDVKTNIIIGDPSSWHILSLTRSKKYKKLINKFQLFIIDDVHQLYSDKTSSLEWICSKIRSITKLNTDNPARLVTLGSPIICADSLRSWLAYERGNKEALMFNYQPSFRPVTLDLKIQEFHHHDYKMRLLTMQRPAYRLVDNLVSRNRDKTAIIFVQDYSQVLETSRSFVRYAKSDNKQPNYHRINVEEIRDIELKECMQFGFGYLYSGMNVRDRKLVEEHYEKQQISILIATVGTCWSLQCRSYLTIIMDTQQHNGQESTDYELTDVIQMIGLTGRPHDHSCVCVIMCQSSKGDIYKRFLDEPLAIESNLPANLISYVNYEVSNGSLQEYNNIYKPYLAHTYFYKRITINPNYYGVVVPYEDSEKKTKVFGDFFSNLVNKVALELEKGEFLSMGSGDNPDFTAGLLSKISLEYYVDYSSLSNYSDWLDDYSRRSGDRDRIISDIINLLSEGTVEFDRMLVRHGELPYLKCLQNRYKRYKESIYDVKGKVKLLILSQYEGDDEIVDGELVEDRRLILSIAYRLLMALIDIAWIKDEYGVARTTLLLAKKLVPFSKRASKPNIEMEINLSKDETQVKIDVTITRDDHPFSMAEFREHYSSLPAYLYRDEGWCFLIKGESRSKKGSVEKFILFKRVKTPNKGNNEYNIEFELTDNAESYIYDLDFMSDFYSRSEDRRVAGIDITTIDAE